MYLIQWAKPISSATPRTWYVITKELTLQTHHSRRVLPHRSKRIKELLKLRQIMEENLPQY